MKVLSSLNITEMLVTEKEYIKSQFLGTVCLTEERQVLEHKRSKTNVGGTTATNHIKQRPCGMRHAALLACSLVFQCHKQRTNPNEMKHLQIYLYLTGSLLFCALCSKSVFNFTMENSSLKYNL